MQRFLILTDRTPMRLRYDIEALMCHDRYFMEPLRRAQNAGIEIQPAEQGLSQMVEWAFALTATYRDEFFPQMTYREFKALLPVSQPEMSNWQVAILELLSEVHGKKKLDAVEPETNPDLAKTSP